MIKKPGSDLNHTSIKDSCQEKCQHEGDKINTFSTQTFRKKWTDYKPLIIIVTFCLILSLAQNQFDIFHPESLMCSFMGYFFVFLSLFKFFDLKGFVEGFSTYDLITQRAPFYGYAYPFIEFFLGLAYLTNFQLVAINLITVVVMGISGVGVLKSILSGQKVKCACLGTILNVPLGTISVFENFGMGAMAAYGMIMYFIPVI